MKIYRHGDVDIKEVKELPRGLKKADNLTLAYGEQTGHHHTLVGNAEVFTDNLGNKWFVANEDCQITHQEHKTLEIKKGFYEVKIEREFDPWSEEINKVKD